MLAVTVTAGTLAAALLAIGLIARSRKSRAGGGATNRFSETTRLPWLLSDRGIATVVIAVAVIGIVALLWMLDVASMTKETQGAGNRFALRIDAIKYGLGTIAAGGAAAALLLAVRRQRHTEADSAHRRVTDLYTKAVEQLGHDAAAVRLGGLYALERVAQDNPDQRQTIVDVLCAYLRMPFALPPEDPATEGKEAAGCLQEQDNPSERDVRSAGSRDARQELQVRLTAQGILTKHLRQSTYSDAKIRAFFWRDIDLDLAGATLVNWNSQGCVVRQASFSEATFSQGAVFDGMTFSDVASFEKTTFACVASFERASFTDTAAFGRAIFTGNAYFDKTTFAMTAWFDTTTFLGNAWFNKATFNGSTRFRRTTFQGNAGFGRAKFLGGVTFSEVTFNGNAGFDGATFFAGGLFRGATFAGVVRFDGANLGGVSAGEPFRGGVWFDAATVPLPRPAPGKDRFPSGWRPEPDPVDPSRLRLFRG